MSHRSIYIGYDPREHQAFTVARWSANQHSALRVKVHGIALAHVQLLGWYQRPTKVDDKGRAIDVISEAPMSTEFAISRFLVPELVKRQGKGGWALFMDCDTLVRRDLDWLFHRAEASPEKALFCVHHEHTPAEGATKMDGQAQTTYQRKNWSSVMLLNVDHPANKALNVELSQHRTGPRPASLLLARRQAHRLATSRLELLGRSQPQDHRPCHRALDQRWPMVRPIQRCALCRRMARRIAGQHRGV